MSEAELFPLPDLIRKRLLADDDPLAWTEVLRVAAEDAAVISRTKERMKLYAIAGSCSHWARPHQSRWTAAGGFAAPEGYGDGEGFIGSLPNLDWSVTLQFDQLSASWVSPQEIPTKRFLSVRLAIPARTTGHPQAAVHAIWSPGTLDKRHRRIVYYGFRRTKSGWRLVAREERGQRSALQESGFNRQSS